MIDTHAHLDSCSDGADAVLERAHEAGVTRVVTIGSGIPSCRESLTIAEQHEGVFCALGIHPHLAGDVGSTDLDELREL
ncbi:MAG: TatD family hydrolase, partial [Gaiellaceae bacterium]